LSVKFDNDDVAGWLQMTPELFRFVFINSPRRD